MSCRNQLQASIYAICIHINPKRVIEIGKKKKKKDLRKMGAAAANKRREKMDVYEYCTTNTIPSPPQTKTFTPPLGNTLQTYFPPSTHSPLPYDTRALTALGIVRKNRVRIRQEGRPDAFALPVPDLDNDVSLFAKKKNTH